jgi:hypothetical protein
MADGGDESGASALYGLPLDEFTRARDELARERRAAGDRAGAAAIKALRKPSVPAWALNQVARNDPALVAALRSAGDQVRSASDRALAGDASELRDATRTLADRAAALADDAAEALAAAGRPATPATYDRIMATVRAAATDDELGEQLAVGMLTEDAEAAGFGLEGLTMPAAAPPSGREQQEAHDRAAERERERRQAEIERTEQRLRRAEGEIAELEQRLEAAQMRADALREDLTRLSEEAGGD